MVPGASVVKLARGVVEPIAPLMLVTPGLLRLRAKPPSIVFANVNALPDKMTLLVRVTASLKVCNPVVVTLLPRLVVPTPSVVKLARAVVEPIAP